MGDTDLVLTRGLMTKARAVSCPPDRDGGHHPDPGVLCAEWVIQSPTMTVGQGLRRPYAP